MPTLKEVTDAIDSRVDQLLPWISEQQNSYKAEYKKYAQLGWSHSIDPSDGVPLNADLLQELLPGKTHTWVNFGYPITEPVCNASIDEYVGPEGSGWILNLSFRFNGKKYMRSINNGPNKKFDSPWTELPEAK